MKIIFLDVDGVLNSDEIRQKENKRRFRFRKITYTKKICTKSTHPLFNRKFRVFFH